MLAGILKTSALGLTDNTKTQYKGKSAPTTKTASTRYRATRRAKSN